MFSKENGKLSFLIQNKIHNLFQTRLVHFYIMGGISSLGNFRLEFLKLIILNVIIVHFKCNSGSSNSSNN